MRMAKAQPLDLIAAKRHDERALAAIVDGQPRFCFDFGAEGGPQPLAFDRQRQEWLAACLVLGGSRQHSGGGEARATAGFAAIEDGDR